MICPMMVLTRKHDPCLDADNGPDIEKGYGECITTNCAMWVPYRYINSVFDQSANMMIQQAETIQPHCGLRGER